jgi:hypothetical protein
VWEEYEEPSPSLNTLTGVSTDELSGVDFSTNFLSSFASVSGEPRAVAIQSHEATALVTYWGDKLLQVNLN